MASNCYFILRRANNVIRPGAHLECAVFRYVIQKGRYFVPQCVRCVQSICLQCLPAEACRCGFERVFTHLELQFSLMKLQF